MVACEMLQRRTKSNLHTTETEERQIQLQETVHIIDVAKPNYLALY